MNVKEMRSFICAAESLFQGFIPLEIIQTKSP